MLQTTKQLAKLSDIIQKKYNALKADEQTATISLEKTFKPITDPLNQLVEKQENKNDFTRINIKRKIEDDTLEDNKDELLNYTPMKARKLFEDTPVVTKQKNLSDTYEDEALHTPDVVFREIIKSPENNHHALQHFTKTYGDVAGKYIYFILSNKDDKLIDNIYGLRYDNAADRLYVGNSVVYIKHNDIEVNEKWYDGTSGLYELLVKQIPKNYSEQDMRNYLEIVTSTNANRRNYDSQGQIQGTKSFKYKNIIKKHLYPSAPASGSGLTLSRVTNNPIDYVYWNTIDELCDRLRLLCASRDAGNFSHQNEINSLIQELREENIIY